MQSMTDLRDGELEVLGGIIDSTLISSLSSQLPDCLTDKWIVLMPSWVLKSLAS